MTSYLIAHKVRGELAFDVAVKATIGDEDGWIIPTSGHRAYPFWHKELEELTFRFPTYEPGEYERMTPLEAAGDVPDSLRDHYAVNDIVPRKQKLTLDDLDLGELGL